ncbi:hypothetical protein T4D_8498 [Trichinella pseudospiralis]|uniref:Uncharacterized protein n=1 Tax=Trichinella pseudospiralis TaxID=6337 RepID=A0A0V1DPE2_TRIPS|nr:hypothetical protein T4D_8498 [Trichinella pseudospiralis]
MKDLLLFGFLEDQMAPDPPLPNFLLILKRSVIIWFPGRPNGTISTITQLSPNSESVKYHLRCWQIFHVFCIHI